MVVTNYKVYNCFFVVALEKFGRNSSFYEGRLNRVSGRRRRTPYLCCKCVRRLCRTSHTKIEIFFIFLIFLLILSPNKTSMNNSLYPSIMPRFLLFTDQFFNNKYQKTYHFWFLSESIHGLGIHGAGNAIRSSDMTQFVRNSILHGGYRLVSRFQAKLRQVCRPCPMYAPSASGSD